MQSNRLWDGKRHPRTEHISEKHRGKRALYLNAIEGHTKRTCVHELAKIFDCFLFCLQGRLPVKWTAIEALLHGQYTTKSDV